ncbi:MAG: hypothetical protein OEX81_05155 [Candidatus Pacebacteria bacterium]|nr:hypothetical protein [Candidatus Paceibacterota bacterium]
MLNSKKLLYVFSDVAYVAELLPAKKKGDFKVQEFRQINGEFLDNDTFIPENIEKLFSKLDKEEYLLVLPDFFFTNTIIEVKEKAKTKVEKHIEEKLLPSLNLSEKTHQIEHFVLTQYGDKSNVQLSAIERSLLAPIFEAAKKHEVKVSKAISLSWTIKSLISLEPSLSLVQMGENLYLVQHYIGIDQATSAPITDVEKIAETIKTLKGAEPSIQTMYLLTNELVEDNLKELLKATLPLQQLSDFKDEKKDLPSYVKQVIEAGAKTLSVTDFNVPEFKVEAVDAELVEEAAKGNKKETKDDKEETESVTEPVTEPDEEPTVEPEEKAVDDSEVVEDVKDPEEEPLPEPTTPPEGEEAITEVSDQEVAAVSDDFVIGGTPDTLKEENNDIVENKEESQKSDMPEETKKPVTDTESDNETTSTEEETGTDALSQFAVIDDSAEEKSEPVKEEKTTKEESKSEMTSEKQKPAEVIKNKTGVSSMLKMVFVSLSVFFLTVGIGVGLGLGYINISNKGEESTTPEVVTEEVVEEVAEASPTPSPEPEIDKETIEILVVNATSKAGYAGTIKKSLTAADFVEVDAGNSKGDYDEGNYVLMSEENKGLIKLIEEATDLEFEFSDEIKIEDIKGSYDAVVVLAE